MNARRRGPGAEHGTTFRTGVVLGWVTIAYGVWIVLANARETRPLNMALFFVGLLLVHDLVVAPTACAVASMLRMRLPRGVRAAVAGAVTTSVLAIALVLPAAIGRTVKVAGNATLVPRDPWASVAVVLVGVWLVAAIVIVRRRVGRTRRGGSAS